MTFAIVAGTFGKPARKAFVEAASTGNRRHVYSAGIDMVSAAVSFKFGFMGRHGYRS